MSYRRNRNTYDSEIRVDDIRCHLGNCRDFKEAVYKRYFAEKLIYKSFANKQEQNRKLRFTKDLSQETKAKLEDAVIKKLQSKQLWQ